MNSRRFALLLVPCCVAALVAGSMVASADKTDKTDKAKATDLAKAAENKASKKGGKKETWPDMVYELRTYTTAEGRLPNLHKRFRDHTMKLFKKHGMKNVVYMTPLEKEHTLVYLIAHKSREEAKKNWKGFMADKEWQRVWAESKKDGPIVTKVESQFLKATDYSPLK